MSNSLRDQLLKAGVATKQQAQNVASQKRKKNKRKGASAAAGQDKQSSQLAHAKKIARDRELNLQRKETADRKAVAAQVRQLIEANRISREGGEVAYNFADGTRVRKLFVTQAQATDLTTGVLAICKLGDVYEIVQAAIAVKIAERDESCVVAGNATRDIGEEDDLYAEYEVPDDLRW